MSRLTKVQWFITVVQLVNTAWYSTTAHPKMWALVFDAAVLVFALTVAATGTVKDSRS